MDACLQHRSMCMTWLALYLIDTMSFDEIKILDVQGQPYDRKMLPSASQLECANTKLTHNSPDSPKHFNVAPTLVMIIPHVLNLHQPQFCLHLSCHSPHMDHNHIITCACVSSYSLVNQAVTQLLGSTSCNLKIITR